MTVALLAVYTMVYTVVPADDAPASERLGAQAGARRAARRAADAAGQAAEAVAQAVTPDKPRAEWDVTAMREPEVWGADPFVRDWMLVNELAELSLRAITLGGERAYALINDQILEEGDLISGKKIIKIEADRVVLEQGSRTFNLLLGD